MTKTNCCQFHSAAPGGPLGGPEGRRWERGQTLVLAALLMIVLVGALALVVDVGNAYTQRRLAQNAADAAALAGVRELALDRKAAQIDAAVKEYAVRRNRGQSYEMAVLTRTVAVTITKTFPTIFAAAVGSPTMTVVAVAEGVYDIPPTMSGVLPMGLDKESVEANLDDPSVQIWDSDKLPSADGIISGGERGWLAFGNKDAGAGEYQLWICGDGYGGDIYSAEACEEMGSTDPNCAWILGSPGSKASGTNLVSECYLPPGERIAIFPVYDAVRQTVYMEPPEDEDKLDYHIVGFAAFTITAVTKEKASDSDPTQVVKVFGEFQNYVTLGPRGGGEENDFGVRVIGLQR